MLNAIKSIIFFLVFSLSMDYSNNSSYASCVQNVDWHLHQGHFVIEYDLCGNEPFYVVDIQYRFEQNDAWKTLTNVTGIGLQKAENDKTILIPIDSIGAVFGHIGFRVNASPFKVLLVEKGSFELGIPATENSKYFSNAHPQVQRTIPNDFYMSAYEVTNKEFSIFLNSIGNQKFMNIPYYKTTSESPIQLINGQYQCNEALLNFPVTNVTWYGAKKYCEWKGGRLPNEAEWTYAVTNKGAFSELHYAGGFKHPISFEQDMLEEVNALIKSNKDLELYGISGNAAEWTADCYERFHSPEQPLAQEHCDLKVVKGGSYKTPPKDQKIGRRYKKTANQHYEDVGFRVVWDKE